MGCGEPVHIHVTKTIGGGTNVERASVLDELWVGCTIFTEYKQVNG